MQRKLVFILSFFLAAAFQCYGQQDNFKNLPLTDMSAFRAQAGNWRIVGDVSMDPSVDIHHEVAAPAAPDKKQSAKNKKAKQTTTPASPRQAVTFSEGTGILLNINDNSRKDNLISILEHGDIDLELEVMLPKGSNSGLYLQGRYEVQLMDSWGVRNAKFSDIGGIYRNWETAPDKIYMGKAPLGNAAKAPGLWQKMKISFRAPRFDASGNKIENARFLSVILNGVVIHENVEVPQATGGPVENNEKAMGTLMIQGDHGPVALRNIRYRLMKNIDYMVSNVTYEIFHGNFKSTNDFASAKPVLSGKAEELSVAVVDVDNAYGIRLKGEVTVPEDARYLFNSLYTGGQKFIFNNSELFNHPTPDGWRSDTASVFLKAGTYPFEILNFKDASWMPPRVALFISTGTSSRKPLHGLSSYPPDDDPTSSIFLNPGSEPRMLRAFLDYKGNRRDRLTHIIAVGDPSNLNYAYDLRSGNLVCVWRGQFADATPMWHDRGDGSFRPLGAALYLTNNQPLAYLNGDKDPFPRASKEGEWRGMGYVIEENTGRPVFNYQYQDLIIEDKVFPDENNTIITHDVSLKKGTVKEGLYYKLGEGSSISQLPDGTFVIDDKAYYIKVAAGSKAAIRDVNGKKELVAPFSQNLRYSIIW
jgi:hypothetical protein